MQTILHIREGDLIRGNQTGFCAHFNGHVAQGHTAFHAQGLDCAAAELHDMTGAACATGFADDRQHDVFGGNARRGLAGNFDLHGFGTALLQGLCRQNVFHFRSTDPERQRTKGTVGGGMGVAADDGHAWQGDALFWPHHVNNALIRVVQVVQFHAEFVAVLDQLLHLDTRHLTGGVDVFRLRRDVMVHRGKGFARLTHRTMVRTQAIKRLRRSYFVNQVAVNIEQRGFVRRFEDHVRIKQLFVQRLRHDYTPSAT